MANDDLGDRMKGYERRETGRAFLPFLPVYARIDGRSFSRFTKGLQRPYDEALAKVMERVTARLVESTGAKIGYTQSDEISLVWITSDIKEEILFAGKVQKMCSILAGMTSSYFMAECQLIATDYPDSDLPERALKSMPHFDARVFQLPSRTEAVNAFVWREQDATKNAVSMAARHYYSHKELQNKSGPEKREMIFQKGVNFHDYPVRFTRGIYLQTRPVMIPIPEDQRLRIPEAHRPASGTLVQRSVTQVLDMPILSKVVNREAVVFDRADPEVHV